MSGIDNLPPLREVIAEHGLRARKELGQNFLLDLNLTMRIARAAGDLSQTTVIEVGPGPGGLTRALLAAGAKKIIAIERDERTLPALAEISAAAPGRLEVISADALEVDYRALADGDTKIIANLPYNIATPLLTGWLSQEPWPAWFSSLTLMFQKEVADRIVASEKDAAYGRLGVLCGWRTDARMVMKVDHNAFTPPPKVTSAVVHLVPRPVDPDVPVRALEEITRHAFGQRRKMIRQSLKGLGVPLESLFDATGLKGDERAENLPVSTYVELARTVARLRRG
ncbi:16S rRNA (adenine(1518)-N(6)/adenine(1519)-N(6))-dimethyltransferase RsmA [Pelagibacterium sediminicola]|uniref:16S rRNA (adenine(1518)-N(6)/adenine(1519)-N(6))- dimethyltransferase RsmA n=1 Tax=Pelagibacterium sediminicola TaxID=2248761 RepID=UPI000E31D4BF|nr:16S rRNA (adenine(1518)-N(6)/adenine(1519)-N(6))-dimethyltransferase RsmA [Pelagibacterium sediminicola]